MTRPAQEYDEAEPDADLERALLALLQHIDAAIDDLVGPASILDNLPPSAAFAGIRLCRDDIDAVEALLAVIAHRGGLTWDAMAAHYSVSNQAHHRRLKARGGRLWADAQNRDPQQPAEMDILDDEVAGEIAALGARELAWRAANPYWGWGGSTGRLDAQTRAQLSRAAELYRAGRRPWPSILRRPDDSELHH